MSNLPVLSLMFLSFLAINIHSQNIIEQDLLAIEEKLYFYPQEGEKEMNSLIINMTDNDYEKVKSKLNFLSGVLAYKKSEPDSAIFYLEKALISFVNNKDELYQAKAQLILGWQAERIGYWEQAKINYYKVIDMVNIQNKREQGLAYLGIARCKHYSGEEKGFELQKGVTLLESMGIKEYRLYAEFLAQVIQNRNRQTPGMLLDIAGEYVKMGLHTNAASVYKGLATYYRQMGEFDSAHKYLDEALALDITNYPSASLLPSLNQMKGLVYFNQKDYNNAERYLKKSLTLCEEYNQEYTKYYIYKIMCRIDTLLGDYESGFIHLSKASKSYMRNNSIGEKQLSKLMETSLNLITIKEENSILKSERNSIVLFSFCVVFVLLVLFTIFYYKHKLKSTEKLKKEKEKKRALHSLLIGLDEKRMFMANKESSIDIKRRMNKDSTFYDDFEECYPESIKKVKANYPQLTQSEARYAVMFSLDLSDDMIAEIRNINAESIRKTRLRMRKKLGMENGCDLGLFFAPAVSKAE